MIKYLLMVFANLLWTLYCIAYFIIACKGPIVGLMQNPQANIVANPGMAIEIMTFFGANYYKWLIPTIVMMLLAKIAKPSKSGHISWDDTAGLPFFVPQTKLEWALISFFAAVVVAILAVKR